MILTRRIALLAVAVLIAGLLEKPGAAAGASVQLKTISSRVSATGTSLAIEASDPVSYVTTRPDPLTVIIDFRNVRAEGLANSVKAMGTGPVANVVVEPVAADVQLTRVRVALTEPVAYRVHSERNTVFVEFDRSSNAPLTAPLIALSQSQTPAPLAQTQAGGTQEAGRTSRVYTGHPISLDFQGADLRAVLRTFADISGLNIVLDPNVQGTVDVALREVPWDQALDQILRANQLGYVLDGTIVRIAPMTTLEAEEKQRLALARAQAEAAELTTWTRQLSYAKGEDIRDILTNARVLSAQGEPVVDERTNTIIITDLESRIVAAQQLIDALDKPQPQVEIEARIVQTNKTYARALGIQWGFNAVASPELGNTTNLAFPNRGSLSGAGPDGNAVNLPASGASSGVGLTLGSVNGAFNLDAALTALERSGNGRLLSTPKVSTLNNVPAEVKQGLTFPVPITANQTTTVQFRDATLKLNVTPQITAAGTVIMQIALANETADFSQQVQGIPSIRTQAATTSVLVRDGETTVIGGIYTSNIITANDSTPGLGQIPLLKWLFKRDSTLDENSELLIFITPRIIPGVAL